MGLLGDIAKAVGLSSDSGANSDPGSDTATNANPNSVSGSLSSIFSIPPTVIKANGGPPGPICDTTCAITDSAQCVGCLERQAAAMSGIRELRTLERVLNINEDKPAVFAPARMKRCEVCSAPFESGKSVCGYCGAPYPDDRICGDIPDEKDKREEFFLKKCEEAYKRFTDWEKYHAKLEEVGAVGKIMGMLSKGKLESRNMTAEDIKAGAASKELSCTDYLSGIILGKIKPAAQESRENKMLATAGVAAAALIATSVASAAASSARQQAAPAPTYTPPPQPRGYTPPPPSYADRSREIEAERQRQLKEIRDAQHQRNLDRIARSAPQYSGGGSTPRCCGSCKYYGAGKCCATGAQFEDRYRNASDSSCGWYSMK